MTLGTFKNLSYICHKEIRGRIVIAELFNNTNNTHKLMFIFRKLNYANYTAECHAVVKRVGTLISVDMIDL